MKAKLNALAARTSQLKNKVAAGGLGAAVLLASGSAHAELPAPVAAAFTTIETNFTDLETAGWPVVATITGGLILIKLFKKFANRAT